MSDIATKLQTVADNQILVYEAGKRVGASESSAFWEGYLNTNQDGTHLFAGAGWKDEIFNPNKDIVVKGGYGMFRHSKLQDVKGKLEELGRKLDTSGASIMDSFANNSAVTAFPLISFKGESGQLVSCFAKCKFLNWLEIELKNDGSQTFNGSVFSECNALSHFRIASGVIGNNVTFQWCPFDKASIMGEEIDLNSDKYLKLSDIDKGQVLTINGKSYYGGVIGALSKSVSGKTITLKKTAVSKAFETTEKANDGTASDEWKSLIAQRSGWTISLK